MNPLQIYILIAIVILAIIAFLVMFIKKKKQRFTPLAGIAFAFIILGIFFGNNRLIGYGLISTGIILSIIDIILKLKKK